MRTFLLLLAMAAGAQAPGYQGDGILSTSDGKGNISTVYNEYNGQYHSIHSSRSTTNGAVLWKVGHWGHGAEKAFAIVMDGEGALYLAGVRGQPGQVRGVLLKYDNYGGLAWEQVDYWGDCTAASLTLDSSGNPIVAEMCKSGGTYPVRVLKYSKDGALLWGRNYDSGGRNYVRSLAADYNGDVSLGVESVFGDFRQGQYLVQTALYDKDGQYLGVRR